uniref:Uncharacterized protein n=1 Tax=Entomoneis paludosa TaxID=265537 RepID=A0A7S3DRH0_9STRA|mmetsp:Transcript_30970/g.64644  ORF Transcript_30970/g.64644 Transcript_30970/m.64644 type:complete len:140 (+) Transcript_30970:48-467(+)
MSLFLTGLRCLVSLPFLPGAAMVGMGLTVLPVDPELWAVANVILQGSVPQPPALLVLGLTKCLAVLGLWGFGPLAPSRPAQMVGLGLPPLLAVYGHSVVGDGKAGGAAGFVVLYALYHYLDAAQEKSKSKDKKETSKAA